MGWRRTYAAEYAEVNRPEFRGDSGRHTPADDPGRGELREPRHEIEGDLDLRTFVGLAGPRAGFTANRATGWVKSPNATTAQLEELCQYVQDTSPVRDCLANPVPVTTDIIVID